ncbi:hypothetical protein N9K77_00405, partial [bacterium]|nr:hypothetical protein [bacterium]
KKELMEWFIKVLKQFSCSSKRLLRKMFHRHYLDLLSFNVCFSSIKNNKNEEFSTLLKNRIVYGGGGIVPSFPFRIHGYVTPLAPQKSLKFL